MSHCVIPYGTWVPVAVRCCSTNCYTLTFLTFVANSTHWIIYRLILQKPSFPNHSTQGRHMDAQVKQQCSVNSVLVLRPAETGSHLSTNGECLAVIFVSAAYAITVTCTVHFGLWLHEWLLKLDKIHTLCQIKRNSCVVYIRQRIFKCTNIHTSFILFF